MYNCNKCSAELTWECTVWCNSCGVVLCKKCATNNGAVDCVCDVSDEEGDVAFITEECAYCIYCWENVYVPI